MEISTVSTSFRPLMTPKDAAKALSVSPSTLRRLVEAGRLSPPIQLSERRIAYRPEDLDKLCATLRRGAK